MSDPARISSMQGVIDALTATGRYAVVIVTFVTAMLGLLKTRDIAGMIVYIQNNGGELLAAISGIIAIGTAAYGIFKSQKRGDQVADAASVPQVKNLELK